MPVDIDEALRGVARGKSEETARKPAPHGAQTPEEEALDRELRGVVARKRTDEQLRAEASPDWDVGANFNHALMAPIHAIMGKKEPAKQKRERERWAEKEPLADVLSRMAGETVGSSLLAGPEMAGIQGLARMLRAPNVGRLLTGNLGGSLGNRMAGGMIPGAWQGAQTGALYGGDGMGGVLPNTLLGAGAGALGPLLGAPFHNNISAPVADMARRWIAGGSPLATGQIPGSSWAARNMARLRMRSLAHGDVPELTAQLMRTTSANPPRLARPQDFDRVQAEAIAARDAHARGVGQIGDMRVLNELNALENRAHDALRTVDPEALNRVRGFLNGIREDIFNRNLDGPQFINWTNRDSGRLDRAINSPNLGLAPWAREVRGILEDALERNAGGQAAREIRLARNRYRNAAALREHADEATGLIDPSRVLGAIESNYGNTAAANQAQALAGNTRTAANPNGAPPIGVLASGAQNFIRPSGVMEHPWGAGGGGLGVLGGLGGAGMYMPWSTAGAVGGTLAGGALGALQNTAAYRNALLNPEGLGALLLGSVPSMFPAGAVSMMQNTGDLRREGEPLRVTIRPREVEEGRA